MECDIGIRMARQTMRVRDFHTAQPKRLAFDQPMHVITAGTARNHARGEHRLGTSEVFGVGDLVEHHISGNRRHLEPGGAHDLRFVCRGLTGPAFE